MNVEPFNGMYTNLIVPQGTNLRSDPRLTPPMLSTALSQTVAFLKSLEKSDPRLYRYDDWWKHDGLHLPRQDELIDFDVLSKLVATPEALNAAMTGEFRVFVGIAPSDFSWYLRFYQDTENSGPSSVGSELTGCFDLTLPSPLVDAYRQQVAVPLELEMQTQASMEYYLSIGLGSYGYSKSEVQKINQARHDELIALMANISQRCYSADWMMGTEFVLWKAMLEGPMAWGQGTITEEDITALKRLSQKTGGWIVWNENTQETFVILQQWLKSYTSLSTSA